MTNEWDKFLRRIRHLKIQGKPLYKYSVMYKSVVDIDVIARGDNKSSAAITLYPSSRDYIAGEIQTVKPVDDNTFYEQIVFLTSNYELLFSIFKRIADTGKIEKSKIKYVGENIVVPEETVDRIMNLVNDKTVLTIYRAKYMNNQPVEISSDDLRILISLPELSVVTEQLVDIIRESRGIVAKRTVKARRIGKGYSVSIGGADSSYYRRYTILTNKYGKVLVFIPVTHNIKENTM